MSAHGIAPARLFTAIALVLGLTFTMFVVHRGRPDHLRGLRPGDGSQGQHGRRLGPQPQGLALPVRRHRPAPLRLLRPDPLGLRPGRQVAAALVVGPGRATSTGSSRSNARRGDLVFFYAYGGVYHVAIYAGHGYIWHAPHSGTRVRRDHIWTRSVFFGRVK